jgi:hypothetical protein
VIAGAWFTVMVKFWVAAGETPLLAVTVPVKTPGAVGVPLIAPAPLKVSPVGNAPLVTLKVDAGDPLAV